jgi:hypothetical protein
MLILVSYNTILLFILFYEYEILSFNKRTIDIFMTLKSNTFTLFIMS